ncbi:MAG: hypothetical protein ACTSVU_02470 [Promethearchaeota archaeon]
MNSLKKATILFGLLFLTLGIGTMLNSASATTDMAAVANDTEKSNIVNYIPPSGGSSLPAKTYIQVQHKEIGSYWNREVDFETINRVYYIDTQNGFTYNLIQPRFDVGLHKYTYTETTKIRIIWNLYYTHTETKTAYAKPSLIQYELFSKATGSGYTNPVDGLHIKLADETVSAYVNLKVGASASAKYKGCGFGVSASATIVNQQRAIDPVSFSHSHPINSNYKSMGSSVKYINTNPSASEARIYDAVAYKTHNAAIKAMTSSTNFDIMVYYTIQWKGHGDIVNLIPQSTITFTLSGWMQLGTPGYYDGCVSDDAEIWKEPVGYYEIDF